MEKFREYIEKLMDGEKIKGIKATPYDVECCIKVYNWLVEYKEAEFINEKVKEILDKCKIETIEYGIGWKASV